VDRKHAYSTKRGAFGVEIRDWANGTTTLRILFHYRGVRCRETLRLAATRQNISYAIRRRAEVVNAIERGTFNYVEFFPESRRAKMFGIKYSEVTVGNLLASYLQQARRCFEYSTVRGYESVCRTHILPQFGVVRIRDLTPMMVVRHESA